MQLWRRVRGLFGTAVTWGAVGAFIEYIDVPCTLPAVAGQRDSLGSGALVAGRLYRCWCAVGFGVRLGIWRGRLALWTPLVSTADDRATFHRVGRCCRRRLPAADLYSRCTARGVGQDSVFLDAHRDERDCRRGLRTSHLRVDQPIAGVASWAGGVAGLPA